MLCFIKVLITNKNLTNLLTNLGKSLFMHITLLLMDQKIKWVQKVLKTDYWGTNGSFYVSTNLKKGLFTRRLELVTP